MFEVIDTHGFGERIKIGSSRNKTFTIREKRVEESEYLKKFGKQYMEIKENRRKQGTLIDMNTLLQKN
ncbi:hypothetical protein [Peribacillus simplex]|uniref:hypothetical protein n=1 Tax=Peribacillus simplex TaxID=1478 RepID=UPI003D2A4951